MSRVFRLLDLFCGAGGAAVGYHRAGFTDIVGVDIAPQPHYPFRFLQRDAIAFLMGLLNRTGATAGYALEDFSAIHASPPCQRFTVARHIHNSGHKHPDLIAKCRDGMERTEKPWVMENVEGAPLAWAVMLCGTMFGLQVLRHRWFETSFVCLVPQHHAHPVGNLTNSNQGYSGRGSRFVSVAGHNFVRQAAAKAMAIDWMQTREELAQAVPPAYCEFIGKQLIRILEKNGKEPGQPAWSHYEVQEPQAVPGW